MLANFLLRRSGEASYDLLLPASLSETIAKRLRMFVLRSRVTVADASGESVRLGVGGPDAGEAIDPETLTRVELPEPRLYDDRVVAHVLYVDGFGNATLNLGHDQVRSTFLRLGERVAVAAGKATIRVPFGRTFADVGPGQGIVYEDSSRNLALAVNRENAAELLQLNPDDEVVLTPAQ
jgi:S-adenosylmethionine hydrolase